MGIGSGPEDVIVVLVRDHREVEDIFLELEHGASAPARRRHLVDAAIAALARHTLAEEQHLYPAVRRHLEDGGPAADREIAEHAEAERLMKRLQGIDPADARFEPLVRDLIASVRAHFDGEEHELLPRLRELCGRDELMELGDKVRQFERDAERRAEDGHTYPPPHPGGPARPAADTTQAPGSGMVDRLRDALTGRGI
ncbi:hemerythrin domain-containing protein [Streptomycetaceae bacterium NBC_01309]